MQSRIFVRIVIAVTIATSIIGVANPAAAISGADWQAGRIIDDTVFNFAGDMSVDQIQAFLNSKVPTCDTQGTQQSEFGGGTRAQYGTAHGFPPPYVCLKDYYENETTHENNLQGRPIPAGAVNTARMIYDAAQASSINPKVLLVTLQKESSGPLVTDTWPFYSQYRTPMGYACPDTAPCDSQYYGFYNQMSSAASQFRRYANFPGNYRYKAAQNNTILYNPSTSCGSSTVYVVNQATASLYNYTPYQPNSGALAGMSDSTAGGTATCGAYGNRNFFWYYNKWFGSTRRNLVTSAGMGVYLEENGAKRPFPSGTVFSSYGYKWSDVLSISKAEIDSLPDGTPVPYNAHYRDGKLVTADGNGTYLVENGTKRAFPSGAIFSSYSWAKWSDVMPISAYELSLIPDGAAMFYNVHYRDSKLVTADGNGTYLVENGAKRPFPSGVVFSSYSWAKWANIVPISAYELSLIPDGAAMFYNVHYRDSKLMTADGNGVYLVENGAKRTFPSGVIFSSYAWAKWADVMPISAYELSLIPDGAAMFYNIHYRDGKLVTATDNGVYSVENGAKRPFPSGAVFSSYGYKWSDVLSITKAEIDLIPDGAAMPPKS